MPSISFTPVKTGAAGSKKHPIIGRRMIVPRMSTVGAGALSAAFRSIGIDAVVAPRSDEKSRALAGRFTTGEECLPQRVTLADFFKVMSENGFDPDRSAFFMPTSAGPCRFGQYANFMRKILRELGHDGALVFSPTSTDQYEGIAHHLTRFKLTAWRAVIASDALRKLTYLFRPYESTPGTVDRIEEDSLSKLCAILSDDGPASRRQLNLLSGAFEEVRDRMVRIPLKEERGTRPLIGMVGEIFIRFNSESNQRIVRRIEALGGEVWIADISEWVWYTNAERERRFRESGTPLSPGMAAAKIRRWVQKHDEEKILAPLKAVFRGREETAVETLLDYSRPYLPQEKAMGEMTLNTGKAIAFGKSGCDGVIDASPFTCMNGIVTEAVYPHVSRDSGGMPIRIFYFDGVPFDLDSGLEIFLEMARSYRKKTRRN
jgi:predicted nucleotide-binding protein (sugar kinase/HSP70/actin superfamily)